MSHPDGNRLVHLVLRRERAREDVEQQKKKIEEESARVTTDITEKFTANYDAVEQELKARTVGLVTLSEMKEKQCEVVSGREVDVGRILGESLTKRLEKEKKEPKDSEPKQLIEKRVLSFADDEEEEEEVVIPKKRFGMDPSVDTTFLPDRDREIELEKKKEDLAREWHAQQDREKNEEITVACAYWDGSSHRKALRIRKGNTIAQFLVKAIEVLRKEFHELKMCIPENLMFVKEDLIIPQHYTFQDFIVTKAMGKTGPLWQFDAVSDIRLRQDAVPCESHPAKIVLRSWYEKNKHIYPASRWEPFIPKKVYENVIDDFSSQYRSEARAVQTAYYDD